MPIPTPRQQEPKRYFIARCMADDVMKKDYTDIKQRVAVCYAQWEKAKKAKAEAEGLAVE
jgi:hypothetical protein